MKLNQSKEREPTRARVKRCKLHTERPFGIELETLQLCTNNYISVKVTIIIK